MLLLQCYTEYLWRYDVFDGVGLTLTVKTAIFYQSITVRTGESTAHLYLNF